MLKLKNVSKFYYNKGNVASGFTKVNLDLDAGEFVVITGESGSGKSTLLNVISGLDTYEEGEMYINGQETSHYSESDFEEYRKKYIGNIFQHFNLVNSYTVYQNVELVLLLNGFKSKEVKKKVLSIIDQVGLTKFKNTKASKLSGGQKQRVAIARALIKETSIIVADEPTGNLDSASSASVLELLHNLSKDKLVVIVTHNYEQVEKYATRKIKMHDGKILEDKKIKKIASDIEAKSMDYKDMKFFNKFRIGLRNTFNLIPKFLLLFAVFLFLILAISGQYSSLKKKSFDENSVMISSYFTDTSDKRILIKKKNNQVFTESDYEVINKLNNIDYLVKDDYAIDSRFSLQNQEFSYYGHVLELDNFKGKLTYGTMPENENEVILRGNEGLYDLSVRGLEMIGKEYKLADHEGINGETSITVKVTGLQLIDSGDSYREEIFASEKVVKESAYLKSVNITNTETIINDNLLKSEPYSNQYKVIGSENIPKGEVYVSENMKMFCKNYRCLKSKINIKFNHLYFTEDYEGTITKEFTKKTIKPLLGLNEYDEYIYTIFMSNDDLKEIFNKGYYQASVYVENSYKIDETDQELKDLGYETLQVKKTLGLPYFEEFRAIGEIIQVIFIAILTVGLFFISSLILKLILKSRNIYFSTIRILGSSRKVAKNLLDIELFTVFNLAYISFLTFVYLVRNKIIVYQPIKELTDFFSLKDYIVLYIILLFMSYLIANRFAKKLFKKSAMKTYREEV